MKIKFSLVNQEVDLTHVFGDPLTRTWFFKNCGIPKETKDEELTNEHKAKLVGLAIYEGQLDSEHFANQSKNTVIHSGK